MKQSVFYLKKLTSAEVGTTKAHVGGYIRLPNDFDYELFFQSKGLDNNGVTEIIFNAYNLNKGIVENNLRFAYFRNSNKERRIPNLATLYKENDIEEGDVVKIESRITNGVAMIYIQFYKNSDIKTSASNVFYVINDNSHEKHDNETELKGAYQQIFYGAPGTGKSNTIKKEVDEQGKLNYRTTFHPDSDYSTFVGCYKPKMKRSTITKDGVTTTEEKIVYSFEPQAFTNAYVQAWKTKDVVFLIIEEINRGNCAQIFGDLFQLLDRKNGESEYPIDADSALADYLQSALSDTERDDIPAEVKSGTKLNLNNS